MIDFKSFFLLKSRARIGQSVNEWLRSLNPGRFKNVLFPTWPRPALAPTQPPVWWLLGLFLLGWSGRGVMLTIHLHPVPRSRKRGSMHPFPHTPSLGNAYSAKHSNTFCFFTFIKLNNCTGAIIKLVDLYSKMKHFKGQVLVSRSRVFLLTAQRRSDEVTIRVSRKSNAVYRGWVYILTVNSETL
jgi:hypothetical protein